MKLKFHIAEVREQLEHAQKAAAHTATWDDLTDKTKWKPDAKPFPNGWVEVTDIDLTKIPARLQVVKDRVIYVMSNGNPRLLASKGKQRSKVAYAIGYGPDAQYRDLVAAVGGDDLSIPLDASDVAPLVAHEGYRIFWVELTKRAIKFGVSKA